MKCLTGIDYIVIIIYFAILLFIGLYLKQKASKSIEHYFLGGKSLPWWALGISGMAAWLDMTGTMVIVSFLYLLGPRALFIELRGGVGLVLVFMMIWIGKWHRRSGVMTAAEWMAFRFGKDKWGVLARLSQVFAQLIFAVGILAYTLEGCGLFLSMFLPYSPLTCSLLIIGITTIYTMMSGFYGVVVTDIFQSICILAGVVFVVILAVTKVAGADIAAVATAVTGNYNWMATSLQWKTEMPVGYENYSLITLVVLFYLFKTIIQGAGVAGDSKYFGAKNSRECGLLSMMCGITLMIRWPLMIGFAILGIFLVKDIFPDQHVLMEASSLIKMHLGEINKIHWNDVLSKIINNPSAFSPDMINGLKQLLDENWSMKLHLVSYEGTVNVERILPAVLLLEIPPFFRGLILVALLAAAMSTISIVINMTTAFLVRDLYQSYLRPQSHNKELITVSYIITVLLVMAGVLMAYSTKNINDIWGWLMMGLSGGMIVPLTFRFYWWRFNGSGFAIGTFVGIIVALVQRFFWQDMAEVWQFSLTVLTGVVASLIGTYLTGPTESDVLEAFYVKTRPFGLWEPLKHILEPSMYNAMVREHRNDLIALPFAMVWMITMFLLPMQLMIKSFFAFSVTLVIFVISCVGIYKFWYLNLDSPTEHIEETPVDLLTVNNSSEGE
ncbi:MAG: sodium:solute symporter [Phycisphaerales bacterium]